MIESLLRSAARIHRPRNPPSLRPQTWANRFVYPVLLQNFRSIGIARDQAVSVLPVPPSPVNVRRPRQAPSLALFLALAATLAAFTVLAQPASFTSEMVRTTLVEAGQPIDLELVVYRPAGPGPFPALVFNHGSTGDGSDPALFDDTWSNAALADVFRERGWIVFFPQRRGRGRSDGLYDEGFTPNRSGYTCDPTRSLAGMERALTDLDAIMAHIRQRPDVRAERMIVGGQSRGGILSIVYAGTRPTAFLGAINFVGGWMSDQCPNPTAINTVSFQRGAAFPGPTLWLYGLNDTFYSLAHSEANYQAFLSRGGQGDFETFYRGPGLNGHYLFLSPPLWTASVDRLLASLPPDSTPTPGPEPPPVVLPGLGTTAADHLLNLSVRAQSGASPIIVGFVIPGDAPRPVIMRGIGPALSRFDVTGVAPTPDLRLFDSAGDLVTIIGPWNAAPALAQAFATVGAFPLNPADVDTADLHTLAPGSYTLHLNDPTGAGLILLGELFAHPTTNASQGLANLSARVTTGQGNATVVTGFVIGGNRPARVLIRAIGPALTPFGVTDAVQDPALKVFDANGEIIATNDNWSDSPDAALIRATAAQVGAFALPDSSADAATLLELAPGAYTVHVASTSSAAAPGTALVETYAVPFNEPTP